VTFCDTDKLDLYRNNFVLRKRISLARNHSAHQELVFKFRHPDRHTTESVDPRPVAEIPHTVRFKEQVLPSLHSDRGIRRIFWHGCKILEPRRSYGRAAVLSPWPARAPSKREVARKAVLARWAKAKKRTK
jgi:hypothetical protein